MNMEKTKTRIEVDSSFGNNRQVAILPRRFNEAKQICKRLNALPTNKYIENRFEQFVVGVAVALWILTPFFWFLGIDGTMFVAKKFEPIAKFFKNVIMGIILTVCTIVYLLIFALKDFFNTVIKLWFIFLPLSIMAIWMIGTVLSYRPQQEKKSQFYTPLPEGIISELTHESNTETPLAEDSEKEKSKVSGYSSREISKFVYTADKELGENNEAYYPNGDYKKVYALMVGVMDNRVHSPLFDDNIHDVLSSPNQFEGVIEEMCTSPKYDVYNPETREIVTTTLSSEHHGYPENMFWEYSFEYIPDQTTLPEEFSESTFPAPPEEYINTCVDYLKEEVSGKSSYVVYSTYTAVEKFESGYYGRRVIFFMANPNGFN